MSCILGSWCCYTGVPCSFYCSLEASHPITIKIHVDTLSALRANRLLPRCRRTPPTRRPPPITTHLHSIKAFTQSKNARQCDRQSKIMTVTFISTPFVPFPWFWYLISVAATARPRATCHFRLSSPDWLSQPREPYDRRLKLDELHLHSFVRCPKGVLE